MLRIGLFGGTFDPVHIGHLRTACEVCEHMQLNRVRLIPAAVPPHKNRGARASAADRLAMLRLAVRDAPYLEISEIELQRQGRSYTVDTLQSLLAGDQGRSRFFLIVGLDAFLEMHTWKSFQDILNLLPLVVMSRPQAGEGRMAAMQSTVADYLRARIGAGYRYQSDRGRFRHERKQPISLCPVSPLAISSTRIRQLARQGRSVQFLVPGQVCRYMTTKGLYR